VRIIARTRLGLLISAAAAAGVVVQAGCASQGREVHNGPECRQFGLPPGSSAYSECIEAGADAYAESHPLTGGHWCSVPPSSPEGRCPGCSVNCADKQAYCTRGRELWLDTPDACVKPAACACIQ